MRRVVIAGLCAGLMLATLAWAQPGANGGFRRSAKMRIGMVLRGVGDLQHSSAPITKPQAQALLKVLRPWQQRPQMTETQATAVVVKLNGILTAKQKNELDKQAALRRRTSAGDRTGNGQAGGRNGGGAGGGSFDRNEMRQRMQQMGAFMRTYNPLYPPNRYADFKKLPDRMQQSFMRRYQDRIKVLAMLAARAK